MMMGYLLASGGMEEGKNVTYLPSYGAEVRGGTANCTVSIADEEIASPVASEPEYVVVMNTPSLIRFQNQVQSGGIIFLNTNLVAMKPTRGDIEVCEIPANDLAVSIGNDKVANMVMLGAFIYKTKLISMKTLKKILTRDVAKRNPRLLETNETALMEGFTYLERRREGNAG